MKRIMQVFIIITILTNTENLIGQDLTKVRNIVDKETKSYRQKLEKNSDNNAIWVDFSVDTFKIEHTISARMSTEYRTQAMNAIVSDGTIEYDKLLNKYYNKLLAKLNSEDKKVLIATQRAWLSFRDNELKLIGVVGKSEYSGGGTIQSNFDVGDYHEIVKRRTIEIFQHLYRTVPF